MIRRWSFLKNLFFFKKPFFFKFFFFKFFFIFFRKNLYFKKFFIKKTKFKRKMFKKFKKKNFWLITLSVFKLWALDYKKNFYINKIFFLYNLFKYNFFYLISYFWKKQFKRNNALIHSFNIFKMYKAFFYWNVPFKNFYSSIVFSNDFKYIKQVNSQFSNLDLTVPFFFFLKNNCYASINTKLTFTVNFFFYLPFLLEFQKIFKLLLLNIIINYYVFKIFLFRY